MNSRQIKILKELNSMESSGKDLAEKFGVTCRTIRNDIKDINSEIKKYGAFINKDQSKNFYMVIEDTKTFKSFIKKYVEKLNLDFSIPENRIRYMSLKFLFSESYIKLDDFIDEMFVSRSTLQNDFKEVKAILANYKVEFEFKPNYGLIAVGKESNIRKAISNLITQKDNFRIYNNGLNTDLFDKNNLMSIRDIILNNIKKSSIKLSDIALNNLIVHIAIALKRIEINQYIDKAFDNELKNRYEYEIAKSILEDIENVFNINFPEVEIYYVTMHLMGTNLVMKNSTFLESNEDTQMLIMAKKIINNFENYSGYNINDDEVLINSIATHLKPAIHRIENNMNIRNPLIESIKENYPIIFLYTKKAVEEVIAEKNLKFNEDEIGYIAIHFMGAVERTKFNRKPIRTLLVCTTGVGSSQLLKYKLKSKFQNQLDIKDTTEYYNLNSYDKKDYDLVISTIPLGDYSHIPYIVIDDILGESNFNEIENFLESNKKRSIKKFLSKENIHLNLDLSTKEEVIGYLCDDLVKQNKAPKKLYDLVMSREKVATTSFGNSVAIPHPIELVTEETILSIATLNKDVKWGNKNVRLVILLNVSVNDYKSLDSMYELLINVVDNSSLVNEILEARTKDEVYKMINI